MTSRRSTRISVDKRFADLVEGRRRQMVMETGRPVTSVVVTREFVKKWSKKLGG